MLYKAQSYRDRTETNAGVKLKKPQDRRPGFSAGHRAALLH